MKILITGGAGFIGSNLALKLVAAEHEVVILDKLSAQIHGNDPGNTSPLYKSIAGKVKFIKGDVCLKEDWEKALDGIDTIVHLAAETGTGQSMYEISNYVSTNIMGTAVLLDILANNRHFNVKKIVLASSRAVYGEGKYLSKELGIVYPQHRAGKDMEAGDFEIKYPGAVTPLELLPTDERSLLHPSSIYGITKMNQEQLLECACKSLDIAYTCFRYQNVYGPGQSLTNPYTGILSIFSTLIRNKKPINIFEDGKESRDFVYIDDVVNATMLGIEKEEANGEVFNVGTGIATSVLEVARILSGKYSIEVPVSISGNFRIGDIRHNYADLSRIREKLGFSPQTDFETGISRFVEWVSGQSVTESSYERSINEMKTKGLIK